MLGNKLFYLTIFALVCVAVSEELVGGHKELTGEDLKTAVEALDTALDKLSTGDGPSYKASTVTKVTTQVVSGKLNTYTVELVDEDVTKQCTVQIWTQPWLKENGTNIKIACEGSDDKLDRTW